MSIDEFKQYQSLNSQPFELIGLNLEPYIDNKKEENRAPLSIKRWYC